MKTPFDESCSHYNLNSESAFLILELFQVPLVNQNYEFHFWNILLLKTIKQPAARDWRDTSNKIGRGWFNHARTITNASAKGLDARQDDYTKEICFPGSLLNNPVRYDSLDASFEMTGCLFYLPNVTKWPILFDILQSAQIFFLSALKCF